MAIKPEDMTFVEYATYVKYGRYRMRPAVFQNRKEAIVEAAREAGFIEWNDAASQAVESLAQGPRSRGRIVTLPSKKTGYLECECGSAKPEMLTLLQYKGAKQIEVSVYRIGNPWIDYWDDAEKLSSEYDARDGGHSYLKEIEVCIEDASRGYRAWTVNPQNGMASPVMKYIYGAGGKDFPAAADV